MKEISIYLAGKMDGLKKSEAMGWREEVKNKIKIINPAFIINSPKYDYYIEHPNLMWDQDYFLIDNSDIILINFDYEKDSPFLGTSMEIGRAFYQRKPIIIFSSKKWVHESITLKYHASAIVNTLDEALDILPNFI